MRVKYKRFSGGYEFKNFQGQPEGRLVQIEIPATVTIPLKQGFGNEAACVVAPGQKVTAGQIIARDDKSISSPVHSSVNGKVVRIEKIDYLGRETTAAVTVTVCWAVTGRRGRYMINSHLSCSVHIRFTQ